MLGMDFRLLASNFLATRARMLNAHRRAIVPRIASPTSEQADGRGLQHVDSACILPPQRRYLLGGNYGTSCPQDAAALHILLRLKK